MPVEHSLVSLRRYSIVSEEPAAVTEGPKISNLKKRGILISEMCPMKCKEEKKMIIRSVFRCVSTVTPPIPTFVHRET
jgi:hypothetical protein